MSDGPSQTIVFPDPTITGRDNIQSVSSEAGEHVGPAFPKASNEGNMVPFQESFGSFTEANIDYRILRSGGVGSAQWGWKLSTDPNDQWRGQGDIRYQTGAHDPFRAFGGKEALGADGHCIIVSEVHNRLIVIKRYNASSTSGSVWIAYRDIGADDKQVYSGYEFKPSDYTYIDEDIECQMKRVGGCELPDGTLRMVANTSSSGKNDLHLFGSDDGGLTWRLLQQNIIGRWFNQRDKSKFPSDVRSVKQLRMASSGDWMRIVWYSSDGYLHTMVSSDRGSTWENLSRTPFKGHYQPGFTQAMTDGGVPSLSMDATGTMDGRDLTGGEPDHQENHRYAYFDVAGLGGPDGGFALIAHARLSTDDGVTEGIDPTTNLLMLSGVRDADWAIARGIPSAAITTGYEDGGFGTSVRDGRGRCLRQALQSYQCVSACVTPFWLYVFVFVTPGATGYRRLAGPSPSGGNSEGMGGGSGYTYGTSGTFAYSAAVGSWSATYLWGGWIGWRVPVNNPYGGALQSMFGDDTEGDSFPGPAGQGKLFAPIATRTAWAGDRIIMLHGATYNGAHDGIAQNGIGLAATTPPDHYSAERPFWEYQDSSTSGSESGVRAFELGYTRRGATIDNPVRLIGGAKQSQYSVGRSWSVVTWWGGWSRLPISDPSRTSIGDQGLNPMFGDYWSVQYGLPHVNAGAQHFSGSAHTPGALQLGAYNQWFNIIGEGTPAPGVYDYAFVDCAQAWTFYRDTSNYDTAEDKCAVSTSMWSSVSDITGVGTYFNASDWSRTNRTAADKTLDWEMDRVSIRLNWANSRSGNTGTGGATSYMYFSSTIKYPDQTPTLQMGSPDGMVRFPGFGAKDNRLWGWASDVTDPYSSSSSIGGMVPLGNTCLIGWTLSCPKDGIAKEQYGDNNPNDPLTRIVDGVDYKFCAVRLTPYLEEGGVGSGGDWNIGDITIAIGSDSAVIVDSSSTTGPYNQLASIQFDPGMGSVDNPIFWDFRLVMYRRDSDDACRVRLAVKRTGVDERWIKSSWATLPMRAAVLGDSAMTGVFHDDIQTCEWGMIDPWVDGALGAVECSQFWREFYVSYYGSGSGWNQSGMSNPDELQGGTCSPTPFYVTNNIYVRWGGGGGFNGDEFTGTIDHTHAVENIFKASPSTAWKSDYSDAPETGSIEFSADTITATTLATDHNQRSSATWLALYGIEDRSVVVDVSYRKDFTTASTIIFKGSSLLSTVTVSSVQDNKLLYTDTTATDANTGIFKEGELAGKYLGWMGGDFGFSARTVRILTNRWYESGKGVIFVDPEGASPGLCLHTYGLSSYGLGSGTGITADIWSDRCAIDLTDASNILYRPGGYTTDQFRNGFSFMRLRFIGPPVIIGGTRFGIITGNATVSGQHTLGTMVLGRGFDFDVPLSWEHSDTTKPNVNITTVASGQKTAYKMSGPRRSVSLSMPGDVNAFRTRLQNSLEIGSDYTKKPVALLLQRDSISTIANDRFNILARFEGEFTNENVGWRRDENNVWIPMGNTSFTFDEEL